MNEQLPSNYGALAYGKQINHHSLISCRNIFPDIRNGQHNRCPFKNCCYYSCIYREDDRIFVSITQKGMSRTLGVIILNSIVLNVILVSEKKIKSVDVLLSVCEGCHRISSRILKECYRCFPVKLLI